MKLRQDARAVVADVVDPELPMLTLDDLGVLRDVRVDGDAVVVVLTPTYSGCPALDAMRDDVVAALSGVGYERVDVRIELSPPWSSDDLSAAGRRKLAAAGIAPPEPVPVRPAGSAIPITLRPALPRLRCPRCASTDTVEAARFGATACKSLHRCRACGEPFEHFKAI